MNESRAAPFRAIGTQTAAGASDCAGLFANHAAWLATLKRCDMVLVRNGSAVWQPTMITDATPCYLFLGKLKFHRSDGWQVGRQAKKVYRMSLRLVRDKGDLQ